ncbi:uncharacterized protein C10orf95 homolog [Myotis myotis]|uniref:Uncharacterized protein n=1 Tax=Myotis myotis TaxID=51298 RepID=A0A7J7TRU1_MYOMY|nr:uncharacterized protein C10orf95 homolog [Myotis myotis]KAF6303506.1 hypothetical protein mMyoMyo1_001646 [Myotis myotis]
MYSYSCLEPGEGAWPPLQPLTYTYLPGPLLLPSIQAPSASGRAAPREYHCFHGAGACPGAAPLWWAFPPAYAAALPPPLPAPGYPGALMPAPAEAGAASWAPWPEGGSLQAELRWGRVERAWGPRLELPDFVRRELRRVYGTYPRTDVRVTFRGGEFLLRAAPRVGEPEVRARRRLLRPPASSGSGSGDSSPAGEAAERGRRKARTGLG